MKAIALILTLAFTSSCSYCMNPANKNTLRCQTQTIASKCGLPEVESIVAQILPQVVSALLTNQWSTFLDQLVTELKNMGIKDPLTIVTCAVGATTANTIVGGFADPQQKAIHQRAVAWMSAHPLVH